MITLKRDLNDKLIIELDKEAKEYFDFLQENTYEDFPSITKELVKKELLYLVESVKGRDEYDDRPRFSDPTGGSILATKK